jgi:CheY-like chemotaxis protein
MASLIPPESFKCPSLAGCEVLLAEDDLDQQRLAATLLQRMGAKVTVEGNGRAAVNRVLMNRGGRLFDVILMDLLMPVLDGAAAAATLRAAACQIPIVALTAVQEPGLGELCQTAGFNFLLHKPVTRTSLAEAIGRFFPKTIAGREPAASGNASRWS